MNDFYLDQDMKWELLPNGRIRLDATCESRLRRAFADFWGTSIASMDVKAASPVDSDLMLDSMPRFAEDRARTLAKPLIDDGSIVSFTATAAFDETGRRVLLSIDATGAEGQSFSFTEFLEIL